MPYTASEIAAQLVAAGAALSSQPGDDTASKTLRAIAEQATDSGDAAEVLRQIAIASGVILDQFARATGTDREVLVCQLVAALDLAEQGPRTG